MSIAGGLHLAFERAAEMTCDCLQVFVKNQRQWQAKPIDDAQIEAWQQTRQASGLGPIIAHAAYLINLAAPQAAIRKKSIAAIIDELVRCHQLGIDWLVMHPGSRVDTGESAGIDRIVAALDQVLDAAEELNSSILLEITAGQGSSIGHKFEHLAEIIERVRRGKRLGICFDTCHAFAAGYELRTDEGYAKTMAALDATVGIGRVRCFHLNDSKKPFGSRVDRHEHLGKGCIGREGFRRIVNDPRFRNIPMVLETPKETDSRGRPMDRVNLALLRRMVKRR